MIALIQRVSQAEVWVNKRQVAAIEQGLLVLIGIEKHDTHSSAQCMLERVLNYRVFSDTADKMNLSVRDINGGLLLVPQFTLPADTRKGNRPSFTPAAGPELARPLFSHFVECAQQTHTQTCAGIFGANMQVSLINDGPVTFWLQTNEK